MRDSVERNLVAMIWPLLCHSLAHLFVDADDEPFKKSTVELLGHGIATVSGNFNRVVPLDDLHSLEVGLGG